MRDLDAYLLDEAAYHGHLDTYLIDGLDSFFDDLQRERLSEFRRLRKLLVSKDCQARREANHEWSFLPYLPKGPVAQRVFIYWRRSRYSDNANRFTRKGSVSEPADLIAKFSSGASNEYKRSIY